MLPTVQNLISNNTYKQLLPDGIDPIRALVLSSTRELANQIVTQAEKLTSLIPSFNIECVLGGTSINPQRERMDAKANGQNKYTGVVDLMIATPGRLLEHIESTNDFVTRLSGLEVLILDEVDQLLEGGFQKNLEVIISKLSPLRQTLCFSATLPDRLMPVLSMALKDDHVVVDCVGKIAEDNVDTHAAIEQLYCIHPIEQSFQILYSSILEEIARKPTDYKILAFLPTARQTQFTTAVLRHMGLDGVLEIHSRIKQNDRNKTSDLFRATSQVILLSSDVSARGVDYPDISLILQLGAPSTKEVYVQRLGRTGRNGKTGVGLLLLCNYEESFLKQLKGLPITKKDILFTDTVSRGINDAATLIDDDLATQTYRAWLQSMIGQRKGLKWSKQDMVDYANRYANFVLGRGTKVIIQFLLYYI